MCHFHLKKLSLLEVLTPTTQMMSFVGDVYTVGVVELTFIADFWDGKRIFARKKKHGKERAWTYVHRSVFVISYLWESPNWLSVISNGGCSSFHFSELNEPFNVRCDFWWDCNLSDEDTRYYIRIVMDVLPKSDVVINAGILPYL